MKQIYIIIIACITLSFTSCNTTAIYETEINDNIRFNIACIEYMIDEVNNPITGELFVLLMSLESGAYFEAIEELDSKPLAPKETYKNRLQNKINNNSKHSDIYKDILKRYNNCRIALSKPKALSSSSNSEAYEIREQNTGITFYFKVDYDYYEIYPYDSDVENYIASQISYY